MLNLDFDVSVAIGNSIEFLYGIIVIGQHSFILLFANLIFSSDSIFLSSLSLVKTYFNTIEMYSSNSHVSLLINSFLVYEGDLQKISSFLIVLSYFINIFIL